jgi:hypothetical protein
MNGTVDAICLRFFTWYLKALRIWLRIRGYLRDFFIDSPLSFIAESRYFPHFLIRRVETLCIIYGRQALLQIDIFRN